jgi:hypothetical protein
MNANDPAEGSHRVAATTISKQEHSGELPLGKPALKFLRCALPMRSVAAMTSPPCVWRRSSTPC